MSRLSELLEVGISLVEPALEGGTKEEEYIHAIIELVDELDCTDKETILSIDQEDDIKTTLCNDKSLINTSFSEETDRICLLSTLVIYEKCRREGMPNHSPKYTARVKKMKDLIKEFYHEPAVV